MGTNRARQITEHISMMLPSEQQQGAELDPDASKGAGFVADYTNPQYAYGGGWWELTGQVDLKHLPQGLQPFVGNPDDLQHAAPEWNKGFSHDTMNFMPSEYTLRGARGFVHSAAKRSDGSPESPTDYNPTGVHPRPKRLAERLLQRSVSE